MRLVQPTPTQATPALLREFAESLNQAASGDLWPFVTVSASYSAGPSDLVIYVTPGGIMTVTLPNPNQTKGKLIHVKRANNTTHTVTISPAAGQIDGAASVTLTTAYQARVFHSDGSNYWSM